MGRFFDWLGRILDRSLNCLGCMIIGTFLFIVFLVIARLVEFAVKGA